MEMRCSSSDVSIYVRLKSVSILMGHSSTAATESYLRSNHVYFLS